ncbi:hypothetical protein ACOBQJ_16390 [Pelotomaculum propionicicum]|uniref:hypothetical protein n=1 Tax=Pelotomaculum propionicicum TaxID=258475 RepID=UPI003B802986
MGTLTTLARPVIEKLLKYDEEELYEMLGMTARAMAADPAIAGMFDPIVSYNEPEMEFVENAREFGRRLFKRWNVETYKFICGDDIDDMIDRRELTEAFSVNDKAVAAALSSLLITHVGLAPALAVVIASLVIKRFSRPGHEEFCKVWKRNLRKYE